MTDFQAIERLKRLHTDRRIVVRPGRAETARFLGRRGRVVTINMNGRAIVQFEGADEAWYDLDLADLADAPPSARPSPDPS